MHGAATTGAPAMIDAHEVAQALAVIAAAAGLLRRALIEKLADQSKLGDAAAVGEEAPGSGPGQARGGCGGSRRTDREVGSGE